MRAFRERVLQHHPLVAVFVLAYAIAWAFSPFGSFADRVLFLSVSSSPLRSTLILALLVTGWHLPLSSWKKADCSPHPGGRSCDHRDVFGTRGFQPHTPEAASS